MDGWTKDDEGRMCLYVPAFSRVNIAHQPMANIKTPITLEFVYKVKNASDYNDPIIYIGDVFAEDGVTLNDSFQGIKITPKNVCLHSRNLVNSSVQDYNTLDEAILDIIVTIVPNYKTTYGHLAQIYCNGVKVRSFEFTSLSEWNVAQNIVLGSDTADLYFYKMRVYHKGFDKTDAMRNFINSLPDSASREAVYNKLLSVTDDSYSLDYDTCVKNGYNTMVIEMLNGKDIPSLLNQEEGLLCNLQINIHNLVDGELDDEMEALLSNTLLESQVIEGQGTTAMTYGRWNFRWKLSSAYNKRRITAKKNFASSMQSHKMGGTRIFNYLHNECVGANEVNANVAVVQYPVFGFQKVLLDDGVSYIYRPIGLYTVGPDKGDKTTFGFNNETYATTIMHLEGSDHTPKSVGFDYPYDHTKFVGKDESMGAITTDGGIVGAWEVGMAGEYDTDTTADESNVQAMLDSEFQPAYNVAYLNSPYIIGVEATLAEMNADVDAWQAQTTESGASYAGYEFWNAVEGYNLYFYNIATKQYEATGVNLLTDLGISASDVSSLTLDEANTLFINARKARFVEQWGNYWHTQDAIFHYVFCLLFGATDNFKKNTYPYKFVSLADGGKWRWRQDDLDTIFDINNQGLAAKPYSILVGDVTSTGSGSVFRGDNSAFWTLIKETQKAEIKAMVHSIFDAMIAHPNASGASTLEKLVGSIRYFFWSFAQEYFPESAYNADTEWTYEDIWANKDAWAEVNPLSQALGGHYEAEVDWVTMRILFCASYFNYGPFTASGYADKSTGQLAYGGANAFTYNITPAIDFNPTAVRGSTETITYGDRAMANITVPLTISASAGADTRIYVQGVDWVKDLGDLSGLTVSADNPTLSVNSKRLQRLKVGDEDASVIPSSGTITGLSLGNCPSMTVVDARNLSTLVGTVDMSLLPRLQEAYFGGTNVTVIRVPDGSKISYLQIPDSLNELRLKDLKFISSEKEVTDFEFNTSGSTATNQGVGNTCPITHTSGSGWAYAVIPCNGYNKFIISGTGGQTTRLWCFLDNSNKILSVASSKVTESHLELSIPDNATTLVVNVNTSYAYSLVGYQGLATLEYNTLDNISLMSIENCPSIDSFGLMKEAYNADGSKLSQIRIVGFNQEGDATDLQMLANMVNDINASGEAHIFTGIGSTDTEVLDNPVIEGTLAITSPIYKADEETLREAYGGAFNLIADGGYYLPIKDPEVLSICATTWGDGVGITEEQAAAVTNIGEIFKGNTNITSFDELSQFQNVGALNNSAFDNCTSLTSIGFNNIETIGGSVCYGTVLNGHLSIPKLKSLGALGAIYYGAFQGTLIESIQDLGQLEVLPSGYNSNICGTFGKCYELTTANLPVTLTSIGNYSFYQCSKLSYVNIPNLPNLLTIGGSAFYGCDLSETELNSDSIETISQYAFDNSNLSGIVNLSHLKTIGGGYNSVFLNCNITEVASLGEITSLPSGYNTNYGIFRGCSLLQKVTLPETLTTLGSYTFKGCSSLTEVNFPSSLTTIGTHAFYNCTSLEIADLSLPNLTSLGGDAFYGVKITKISDLGQITALPWANSSSQNYGDKSTLTEVVLPDTVTSIYGYSFYGYSALSSINLPNALTTLNDQAFYNCTSLEITDLSSPNLTTIGGQAFYNCSKISGDIILPSLTTLGNSSFRYTNIVSVLDLGSVTTILQYAFGNCKSLKVAIFPNTVTSIGSYVFSDAGTSVSKTLICKAETPPTCGSKIFSGSSLAGIYVPDASVDSYREATNWATYASSIFPISQLATDNPNLYAEIQEYL